MQFNRFAILVPFFNLNFNLINANHENGTIFLERVIKGNVPHGSWGKAIPLLKERFIRIRFEDLLLYPLEAYRISATITIRLGYNPANKMSSFEDLNRKDPNHFRASKVKGWEENSADVQMQLLEKLHRATINELGYVTPKPMKISSM